MNVLIVEDDDFARDASVRYLDNLGYEVCSASTPDEAKRRAGESPPDVVICDWMLGTDTDGAELARSLQERYEALIIFVTAHPLSGLRARTRDLQVARYFRKPISLALLASTLDSLQASS